MPIQAPRVNPYREAEESLIQSITTSKKILSTLSIVFGSLSASYLIPNVCQITKKVTSLAFSSLTFPSLPWEQPTALAARQWHEIEDCDQSRRLLAVSIIFGAASVVFEGFCISLPFIFPYLTALALQIDNLQNMAQQMDRIPAETYLKASLTLVV